jgi:hypothetical protein
MTFLWRTDWWVVASHQSIARTNLVALHKVLIADPGRPKISSRLTRCLPRPLFCGTSRGALSRRCRRVRAPVVACRSNTKPPPKPRECVGPKLRAYSATLVRSPRNVVRGSALELKRC